MKLTGIDTPLNAPDGMPMVGAPVPPKKDPNDPEPAKDAPWTLKVMMKESLGTFLRNDENQGVKHIMRLGNLMKKLSEVDEEIEIDVDDVALIKERMAFRFEKWIPLAWAGLTAIECATKND